MAESAYRVRESFAVSDKSGMPRVLQAGSFVKGDDPLVKTHRSLLQPMSEHIEQTTAAPGEQRPIRLPSAVTAEDATKARDTRNGPRDSQGEPMPHALPPEHPDSPASPFAPGQPGAGIVADDTPPEQNPGGGTKAADAPTIENTPPEPQTAMQAANAEAQKDATAKTAGGKSTKK